MRVSKSGFLITHLITPHMKTSSSAQFSREKGATILTSPLGEVDSESHLYMGGGGPTTTATADRLRGLP